MSHSQLREFVTLLNVSIGGQECGHNWTQRFLIRRPELQAKMGTKIDTLRLKNTTPNKLRPWFDSLQALIRRLRVRPPNIYNVDEIGIALGVYNSHTVIGTTMSTKSYIQTPENREWVSIIKCVSASGQKIKCHECLAYGPGTLWRMDQDQGTMASSKRRYQALEAY